MKKNNKKHPSRDIPKNLYAGGFALIEVLTSLVILSVGLLGLAGLQVIGMKGTQHASMQMQATLLTQNLVEKMRANPMGDYEQVVDCNTSLANDCGLIANTCNTDQLAFYHLYRTQCGTQSGSQHIGGIKHLLNNGALQVNCTSGICANGVTVTTSWDERVVDEHQVATDGVITRKLQMSAEI